MKYQMGTPPPETYPYFAQKFVEDEQGCHLWIGNTMPIKRREHEAEIPGKKNLRLH